MDFIKQLDPAKMAPSLPSTHGQSDALPRFYSNLPVVMQATADTRKHDAEAALCLRWLQIGD